MNANELLGMSPALLFEHVRNQRIATGRLMTPAEVRDALLKREDVSPKVAGWHLCGSVHPDMYPTLRAAARELEHRAVVFPTASGRQYLVVGQRVGEWEHRFVLPLAGPTVEQFAGALHGQPLRLSLATESEAMALVTEVPFYPKEVDACIEAVGEFDAPLSVLFEESAAVAVSMLAPEAWGTGDASLDGVKTCVTLVAHPMINDLLTSARLPENAMMVH
jgi:hypothetical protein